MQDTLSICWWN